MASCVPVTLTGIDGKCQTAVGGIKRILIAEKDNVKAELNKEEGVITAFTLADDANWYEWTFRKNTGSLSTSIASDPAIGTSSVTTELNLQFTKMEKTKRLEIQSAINANSVVIVELQDKDLDDNNIAVFLGYDNEVNVTAANMQSGTAQGDLNGFTLTLQDISNELPYFVSKEAMPTPYKKPE